MPSPTDSRTQVLTFAPSASSASSARMHEFTTSARLTRLPLFAFAVRICMLVGLAVLAGDIMSSFVNVLCAWRPETFGPAAKPKMAEGSRGSLLVGFVDSVASARAFLRTAMERAKPWRGFRHGARFRHRARLVEWCCWHCFGCVSQSLRQALRGH